MCTLVRRLPEETLKPFVVARLFTLILVAELIPAGSLLVKERKECSAPVKCSCVLNYLLWGKDTSFASTVMKRQLADQAVTFSCAGCLLCVFGGEERVQVSSVFVSWERCLLRFYCTEVSVGRSRSHTQLCWRSPLCFRGRGKSAGLICLRQLGEMPPSLLLY